MDTLLQQAQSIATAAKKLNLEIKATKVTTTPEKQIMLELAQLAIDGQTFLFLSVDITRDVFMSSTDVHLYQLNGSVDGASCRVVLGSFSEVFLDDLLAYKETVLANIELAKEQQRLAEEKFA
ncbi:hypothetical protein [Photobacterium phosphoreum]|uniref:hypothetical protein n=1 Tax=Photobacterium phosphoreum TaxID=659 RepID=UPI001E5B267A|nr:hypothetical protein [Photobacterium phosphoreum]MCD9511916.1 hypothetical protein [Photobacterium phosphoreum]